MNHRRTDMIGVHDLPEAIAQAIAQNVQAVRQELNKNGKTPGPLGAWAIGSTPPLTRDEIYCDRLDPAFEFLRDEPDLYS